MVKRVPEEIHRDEIFGMSGVGIVGRVVVPQNSVVVAPYRNPWNVAGRYLFRLHQRPCGHVEQVADTEFLVSHHHTASPRMRLLTFQVR